MLFYIEGQILTLAQGENRYFAFTFLKLNMFSAPKYILINKSVFH